MHAHDQAYGHSPRSSSSPELHTSGWRELPGPLASNTLRHNEITSERPRHKQYA